jgi:hypothetical protein
MGFGNTGTFAIGDFCPPKNMRFGNAGAIADDRRFLPPRNMRFASGNAGAFLAISPSKEYMKFGDTSAFSGDMTGDIYGGTLERQHSSLGTLINVTSHVRS